MSLAPEEVELSNGNYAKLQYLSPFMPYVTVPHGKNAYQVLKNSNLKLPDGRDILVKTLDGSEQAVYLRADEL